MKTFKQYLTEANNITLYRKIDDVKVVIEPDGSYTFWKDGGKTKGAQNRSLHGQQGAVKELMAIGYKPAQSLNEAVLPTQNEGWGFFGTITMEFDHNSYEKAKEAWKIAFQEVQKATGWADKEVRDWLDSGDGRQFADQCADFGAGKNPADGISQAAKFWKERKWFK